jgi:dienelactone hydrolase
VHPGGIDEPRLISFARALSAEGLTVTTPELASFAALRLDPRVVDDLGRCVEWLAARSARRSIGAIGISVGGGVLLRVAARTRSVHAIWTIGAHHDLAGLDDFWFAPAEEHYGAQVLAHAFADEYFEPADAPRAARAIRAGFTGEAGPTLEPSLAASVRALRQPVLAPDVVERLRAILDRHGAQLRALSPRGHLGDVDARVFVLHGADDPIVPAEEARAIARELRPGERAQVLRSPVLRHAETPASSSVADQWRLVRFAAAALDAF